MQNDAANVEYCQNVEIFQKVMIEVKRNLRGMKLLTAVSEMLSLISAVVLPRNFS